MALMSPFQFNPAYAGLSDRIILQGSIREQWVNLPGSPSSRFFLADAPVPALGSGVGLRIQEERFGASRQLTIGLGWSVSRTLSKGTVLALGLGVSQVRRGLQGSLLRTPSGSYGPNQLDHRDEGLPAGDLVMQALSSEGGIYLKTPFLEAGLAATHLLPVKLDGGGLQLVLQPHYTFSAKGFLPVNTQLILEPGMLGRYVAGAFQLDTWISGNLREKFTLGTGFRGFSPATLDACLVTGGISLSERLSLQYTYAIPLSPLRTVQAGSHEFMVRYHIDAKLGRGVLPPIIYNPRNL